MIAPDTDVLCRSDKLTGEMQRVSMEAFVPLHLSALERSTELRSWLTAAAKGLDPRPSNLHIIVVVPCLMTGRWRRHMTWECDCYFRIPAGSTLKRGKTQYGPLLIFICLLTFYGAQAQFLSKTQIVGRLLQGHAARRLVENNSC